MKGIAVQIILCIIYLLAGYLLAIPYCMLAGWDEEAFPMVAFVAPVFLLVWFMLALFVGIIDLGGRGVIRFNWRAAFRSSYLTSPGLLPVQLFWAWAIYSLLPIIFHWSSILLEKIGFNTVASFINTHRYASPLYTVAVAIALLIVAFMVVSVRDAAKKRWARIKPS